MPTGTGDSARKCAFCQRVFKYDKYVGWGDIGNHIIGIHFYEVTQKVDE